MLRRSLKYLVVSLLIFLSFNSEVMADKIPELTCRYYNEKMSYIIAQDKDGKGYIHKHHSGGAEITETVAGWRAVAELGNLRWGDKYKESSPKLSASKPKYLKECPVAVRANWGKYYIFTSTTSEGYKKLYKENKMVELKGTSNNYIKPAIGKGIGSATEDSDNSGVDTTVDVDLDIGFVDTRGQKLTCEDIFGEDDEIIKLLKTMFNLIKIIVPILVVVLGSLDFVSAIFAQDDGNMKKAQSKFIKRLIIAVAIFLAPSILKFILTIGHEIWPVVDASLCGII